MASLPVTQSTRLPVPQFVIAALPALALAIAFMVQSPIGYLGGGGDDWQYLEAARCLVEQGWCLPQTHWAARLPMTYSTAAAILLFGEARQTLWLVPIVYGLAGLSFFVSVMLERFGRRPAMIASIALVSTPAFGGQLLSLNVSLVEFGFAMAGLFALHRAALGNVRAWAMGGGAMIGLAIMSRTTSLALLPILFLVLVRMDRARLVAPLLGGVILPLACEAAVYGAITGNPAFSWALALGHTGLQSSALPAGVEPGLSPLFNPAVIGGWAQTMGIDIHWSVNGAINLLLDPAMGPTLVAAMGLLLLYRRDAGDTGWILAAGAAYFAALTYGLAVHPMPRMFLPVAAAAAAVIGVLGARAGYGRITAALLVLLIANGALHGARNFDMRRIERVAEAWVQAEPDRWAIDETARRVLTLSPLVRSLPADPALGRDRLMLIGSGYCGRDIARPTGVTWRLVQSTAFETPNVADRFVLCGYRPQPIGL